MTEATSSSERPTRRWAGVGLLGPAALLLALVFIVPMIGITILSFHPSLGQTRVGAAYTMRNYAEFLTDPFYLRVLANSIRLAAVTVAVTLALGYPTAYFLARTTSRFRGLFNFLVFAPLMVSILIRNLGWLPLLGLSGTVNTILLDMGVIDRPLLLANDEIGVTIGLVHALLPYMILTLAGVIRTIGPELEEASINLGAGPIRTFIRVLLPLSWPGLVTGSLLVFTLAVGAFTTPAIMGGNRVEVMPIYIAQQMFTLLNYARGATAAVVLLILTGALIVASVYFGERKGGVDMNRALLNGFAALVLLFLLLPLVVVVVTSFGASDLMRFPPTEFSWHAYTRIPDEFYGAMVTSLIIAAGSTLLSVVVGTPAAIALVRQRFVGRGIVNAVFVSPLVVPTLVIAVAASQFFDVVWRSIGFDLQDSYTGIILAHSSFTMAFVIRATIAAQANFDLAVEEASTNLGARPIETFFRITLPLIAPGVAAGAVFAFLTSFDELPIAMFLGGARVAPLSVKLYFAIQDSLDTWIMALATIIILVSMGLIGVMQKFLSVAGPMQRR